MSCTYRRKMASVVTLGHIHWKRLKTTMLQRNETDTLYVIFFFCIAVRNLQQMTIKMMRTMRNQVMNFSEPTRSNGLRWDSPALWYR